MPAQQDQLSLPKNLLSLNRKSGVTNEIYHFERKNILHKTLGTNLR